MQAAKKFTADVWKNWSLPSPPSFLAVRYSFKAWIKNEGKNFVKIIKLAHTSSDFPSGIKGSYNPVEGMVLPMLISDFCFRFTSPCKETIYPNEIIETGLYSLEIPIKP